MPRKKKAVAPPPPPPEKKEEVLPTVIKVRCPICQTHWANATIEFDAPITPDQFGIVPELKDKVKFQKNGLPYCPVCNFKYDERSMYGLLIAAANEQEMERKAWKR